MKRLCTTASRYQDGRGARYQEVGDTSNRVKEFCRDRGNVADVLPGNDIIVFHVLLESATLILCPHLVRHARAACHTFVERGADRVARRVIVNFAKPRAARASTAIRGFVDAPCANAPLGRSHGLSNGGHPYHGNEEHAQDSHGVVHRLNEKNRFANSDKNFVLRVEGRTSVVKFSL